MPASAQAKWLVAMNGTSSDDMQQVEHLEREELTNNDYLPLE